MVNHLLTIFEEKWQHFLRSITTNNDYIVTAIMGIKKTHHRTYVMLVSANFIGDWRSKNHAVWGMFFGGLLTHAFLHGKIKKKTHKNGGECRL
jgi:hypothetical protein